AGRVRAPGPDLSGRARFGALARGVTGMGVSGRWWCRIVVATLGALLAAAAARGQGLPGDLRPFVRLDYEYSVRRYKDPITAAEVEPKRPLDAPDWKYRAKVIAAYPERDMAVLKITTLASGAPVVKPAFATMPIGNPYGVPLGGELRILGYPDKGGKSLTPT